MVLEKNEKDTLPNIGDCKTVADYLNALSWPSMFKTPQNQPFELFIFDDKTKYLCDAVKAKQESYAIHDPKIGNGFYTIYIEAVTSGTGYGYFKGIDLFIEYRDTFNCVLRIGDKKRFLFDTCQVNPDKGPYNIQYFDDQFQMRLLYTREGKGAWYKDVEPLSLKPFMDNIVEYLQECLRPGSSIIIH
jgi:hypothetical protein